jgi:hypothetical protein
VVQRAKGSRDVELERPEGQMLRITEHDLDVARSIRAGTLDHARVTVEGHHLAHARCECVRERTRTSPDIERPLVTAQRQEAPDALRKRGRTPSL